MMVLLMKIEVEGVSTKSQPYEKTEDAKKRNSEFREKKVESLASSDRHREKGGEKPHLSTHTSS